MTERLLKRNWVLRIRLLYISGKNLPWLDQECTDYCQRVRAPLRLEQHPLSLSKFHGRNDSKAIQQESEALLQASVGQTRVVLDATGKQHDSISFAKWLENLSSQYAVISILLGGPAGFNEHTHQHSDFSLALSKMTWPHTLARLLVCEQIYRASTITYGGKYHK